MKKYYIKLVVKYSLLFLVLIILTILVYNKGISDYKTYLENNKDDEKWISEHINLVEDTKIGTGVLKVDMPTNLEVSDELYKETIDEEINNLLIHNYKINNPLIVYDPYKNNPASINLYFHTGNSYKFEYYITTEAIDLEDDITYIRMKDDTGLDVLNTKHFYVLEGFVQGKRNNLLIRILDENDQVIDAENFIINIPGE